MEWILDIVLVVLLAATLFHAIRLERALGVLKRDGESLRALVANFDSSTHAAESGVERLRAATDGAGRQIQRQIEAATTLREDLTFLVQRGEGLADRLDDTVRATRSHATPEPALARGSRSPPASVASMERATSSATLERAASAATLERAPADRSVVETEPKVRSQAERDLLKALRMAR